MDLFKEPSLPVWERGLKFFCDMALSQFLLVAPRVGAWIEIPLVAPVLRLAPSLPVWERGLKSGIGRYVENVFSRSPCGSVD